MSQTSSGPKNSNTNGTKNGSGLRTASAGLVGLIGFVAAIVVAVLMYALLHHITVPGTETINGNTYSTGRHQHLSGAIQFFPAAFAFMAIAGITVRAINRIKRDDSSRISGSGPASN